MVDGIKDVSERIQFGSLILKNSGDMVASVFWSATSSTSDIHIHAQKVQLYAFIASLRSELRCQHNDLLKLHLYPGFSEGGAKVVSEH